MRSLVFWGLFPFVLVQALRVRKSAPRLAAAEGPMQGTVGSGSPLRLLAIGDSIIAGVGAASLDKALVCQTALALAKTLQRSVHWEAIGSIGAQSDAVLRQLVPRMSAHPADVILLSVGVNDVTSLCRSSVWAKNLATLLAALSAHSPTALIAVAGIPPLEIFPLLPHPLRALLGFRGTTFDVIAQRIALAHAQAMHIPVEFETHSDKFSADGFHPSEQSYAEFGHAIASQLALRLLAATASA